MRVPNRILQALHLSESQRAAIAAKIANMTQSDNLPEIGGKVAKSDESAQSANLHTPPVSLQEAADMMNVSRRSAAKARRIMREAPEIVKEIERGERTEGRDYAREKWAAFNEMCNSTIEIDIDDWGKRDVE